MGRLRETTLTEARDPAFALFLLAIASSFVKAVDQPGLTFDAIGTSARVTISDALLATLAVVVAARVWRRRSYPRNTLSLTAAATVFAGLIVLTAVANGGTALVAAVKLVTLGALFVGAVVLIDSPGRLWVVGLLIVFVTGVAVVWALVGFVQNPGHRQAAFLGEHDIAAMSTACLVIWLATLFAGHHRGRLPVLAGIVGALGIALGAALASLLGLYLAAAALFVAAAVRGSLRLRPVAITLLVAIVLTGATYSLRARDLGFLQQWFAPAENAKPGEYAGSWSQRLIFLYIGGRVFAEHPLLGTGWWGNLPPREYARFLPAARARFPDQPSHYFPKANGVFIPQQTYDQVLYELGLVGIAALLGLISVAARDALGAVSRWPRADPDALEAFLAAPWLASLLGAIAGFALFGGTPMAALFWLTLGLVGALSTLARQSSRSTPAETA